MDNSGFEQGFRYMRNMTLIGVIILLVLVGSGAYFVGKYNNNKVPVKTELPPCPIDSVDYVATEKGDTLTVTRETKVIIVQPGQDPDKVLDCYIKQEEANYSDVEDDYKL